MATKKIKDVMHDFGELGKWSESTLRCQVQEGDTVT